MSDHVKVLERLAACEGEETFINAEDAAALRAAIALSASPHAEPVGWGQLLDRLIERAFAWGDACSVDGFNLSDAMTGRGDSHITGIGEDVASVRKQIEDLTAPVQSAVTDEAVERLAAWFTRNAMVHIRHGEQSTADDYRDHARDALTAALRPADAASQEHGHAE